MVAIQGPGHRIFAWGTEAPHLRRMWALLSLLIILSYLISPASAVQKRAKSPQKPKGIIHVVEAGQTLFASTQPYRVRVSILREANHIKSSTRLKPGQRLFIPGAKSVKKVKVSRPLTTQ